MTEADSEFAAKDIQQQKSGAAGSDAVGSGSGSNRRASLIFSARKLFNKATSNEPAEMTPDQQPTSPQSATIPGFEVEHSPAVPISSGPKNNQDSRSESVSSGSHVSSLNSTSISFSSIPPTIKSVYKHATPPDDSPHPSNADGASSASLSSVDIGSNTPREHNTFLVGVAEDVNIKCRRTMEDTHRYIYDFAGVRDQGYFAIFDGHAGNQAADWCGSNFHGLLAHALNRPVTTSASTGILRDIPEILDLVFTRADHALSMLPTSQRNSGCTAAVALTKWETRIIPGGKRRKGQSAKHAIDADTREDNQAELVRMLYTANVGDARIVLCRKGKAVRLSYDHKGTDKRETKRINDAGGVMLNSRVNGVLAVTRALGDVYMKDLITGHPYTTETYLYPKYDKFIIIACDGLWDVCTDQDACDLVQNIHDPEEASRALVDHALAKHSTDNLSCMVVRFKK